MKLVLKDAPAQRIPNGAYHVCARTVGQVSNCYEAPLLMGIKAA